MFSPNIIIERNANWKFRAQYDSLYTRTLCKYLLQQLPSVLDEDEPTSSGSQLLRLRKLIYSTSVSENAKKSMSAEVQYA
mmetsp:Transcript_18283/g.31117  ORF Transcript_18283/g.31117 Transcript_18283/m.31117 type:complete len:80 (-) Transcript_18283:1115-1354(-)